MARLLLCAFVIIACFCGVHGAHAQPQPARIALLIGNQAYSDQVGPLKNPHNDVVLLDAALKQLGFAVTVLKDAGYRDMDTAIKRHIADVRRAGAGALSFFYYSGHGVANPETQINYLIPTDVRDANDPGLWHLSFEQNDIIEKLNRQAPQATHYVVFDACRNELRLSGAGQKALGAEKGFVPVAQTAGLLIAYATAPKQTASDVGDGGGPYARALAAEIVKPGIEAVTMFRNVQLKVKQSIGQDPWLSFPSLPEVYLAGRTPSPATAAAPPPPATPTVSDAGASPRLEANVPLADRITRFQKLLPAGFVRMPYAMSAFDNRKKCRTDVGSRRLCRVYPTAIFTNAPPPLVGSLDAGQILADDLSLEWRLRPLAAGSRFVFYFGVEPTISIYAIGYRAGTSASPLDFPSEIRIAPMTSQGLGMDIELILRPSVDSSEQMQTLQLPHAPALALAFHTSQERTSISIGKISFWVTD